jgi:hypothetical protein
MNHGELLTLLQNRELTMSILNILQKEDGVFSKAVKKNRALDEAFGISSNEEKNRPPQSIDIRGKGYRAPSKLIRDYVWQVGDEVIIWSDASESGLRRAFANAGYKTSIDNEGKNKRRIEITELLGESNQYSYARKRKV